MIKSMGEVREASVMPMSRKVLCGAYVVIAVVAAIATWTQAGPYSHSITDVLWTFWKDAKVNAAGRFLAADVLLLGTAVSVLAVVEARKHQIGFVWAYLIGGIFVGISVTVPLFLLARELKMRESSPPGLTVVDGILFAVFTALVGGVVYYVDFV